MSEYKYRFRRVSPEKIYGSVICRFAETHKLKSGVSNWFNETTETSCKKLADKFQETKLVSAIIKKPFEETSPMECTLIIGFEETRQILAPITWEFSLTIYARIMGKITTEEKECLNELKWL